MSREEQQEYNIYILINNPMKTQPDNIQEAKYRFQNCT